MPDAAPETMPNEEFFAFQSEGEMYSVAVTPTVLPADDLERYGLQEDVQTMAIAQMQKTRLLIRNCARQAVSAFRDFDLAEVEEVNIKFNIKLGGKAGIPYITEGSAESNLEISVKCTLPKSSAHEH
jgi:Trypsin-co-occurring domain 1